MTSGNRKQRRAHDAKATPDSGGHGFQPTTQLDQDGVEMILKHPDYSGPKGKTLFQLAEERQRELDRAKSGGRGSSTRGGSEEAEVGAVGDALLYAMSMAALHLTLDVLVYSQYREEVVWGEIVRRAATAMPVFMLLVYLTHVGLAYRFPLARDAAFCVGSVLAGCYLVYAANKHGYFYVMKAAPPVGTLWVWSVVEMSLPFAALNVVAVLAFTWFQGYEIV